LILLVFLSFSAIFTALSVPQLGGSLKKPLFSGVFTYFLWDDCEIASQIATGSANLHDLNNGASFFSAAPRLLCITLGKRACNKKQRPVFQPAAATLRITE